MLNALTFNMSLQNTLCPQDQTTIKKALMLLFGVILLAAAAQLSIPLQPVPLTFQSTTVVLIGMALGARYGAYTMGAYLLAGFCGLPVFANFSAGPTCFAGPTAGYLIGFLPAAFVSGYLSQKGMAAHWLTSFLAACLSVSIIFIFGIAWLALSVGWQAAFMVGFMPFIISEPIKLIAVAICAPSLWKKQ